MKQSRCLDETSAFVKLGLKKNNNLGNKRNWREMYKKNKFQNASK